MDGVEEEEVVIGGVVGDEAVVLEGGDWQGFKVKELGLLGEGVRERGKKRYVNDSDTYDSTYMIEYDDR